VNTFIYKKHQKQVLMLPKSASCKTEFLSAPCYEVDRETLSLHITKFQSKFIYIISRDWIYHKL